MSSNSPVTTMWQRHSIRGDIQGLRAVAVLLVLVYHVWPNALPGGYVGVDVFFVISGYLIVGSLVRELEREGKIRLLDFYRRRSRRLMPAALTVLAAILAGTILWLPEARWEDTVLQVVASALYVQNWYLAGASVDYLAAENSPSPALHYWSLSIEEQFYITWPLVMALLGWVLTRLKFPVRVVVGVVLAGVFTASFLCSVSLTSTSAAQSYFFSHTRFWEIAAGGLIATVLPAASLGTMARAGLFGVGLACILVAGFTYGDVAFPGWAALLPVVGTGMILVAGAFNLGTFRGLDIQPLRYVGDISYSLYLWHWPVIVFYTAMRGSVGIASGFALILLTLVLSHLSFRYVEERFRYRAMTLSMGPLASGFAGMAVVTVCSLLLYSGIMSAKPPAAADAGPNDYPGPAALLSDAPVPANVSPIPAAAHLLRDRSAVYDSGCHQNMQSHEVATCILGSENAEFTVAVVGSSHSVNWLPAINLLGRKNGWRVVSITKSACGFQSAGPPSCRRWHENVAAYLKENVPDLVIVGESVDGTSNREQLERVAARVSRVVQLGVPVIGISPTPKLEKSPADCLPDRQHECEAPRDAVMRFNAFELAQESHESVLVIDMSDAICGPESCGAVVGNVVVFRDRHHLTATYSRALAPYLEERIVGLGDGLVPISQDPWPATLFRPMDLTTSLPILRCGGLGDGPKPFARSYQVEYEEGRLTFRRGDYESKERNYEIWDGRVQRQVVKITGSYIEGQGGVKSINFEGTIVDGVLIAGGKRGPRTCSVHWSPSHKFGEG